MSMCKCDDGKWRDDIAPHIERCHWCELEMYRPSKDLPWIDEYNSKWCEFHPAAWSADEMKTTHIEAPHQTIAEIHAIIKAEFHKNEAIRSRTPLRSVEDNYVAVSKKANSTSTKAAEKYFPRSGSIRAKVYEAIKMRCQNGLTDNELEDILKGKHQTVSASRRSLVIDGFVVDSGITRPNPQGNDCVVWVEKSYAFDAVLFGGFNG